MIPANPTPCTTQSAAVPLLGPAGRPGPPRHLKQRQQQQRPGLEPVRSSHRLQRSRQVGDSNSEGVKIASRSSMFSCSARSQSVRPASLHPHPSLRLPRGVGLEAAGASLEGEQGPAARRIEEGRWPAVGHWAPQRSLLYPVCPQRS